MRGTSRARQLLGAALLIGVLAAVIAAVLPEWRQIDWRALSLDRSSLLFSAAALVSARVFHALAFSQTLAALAAPLPTRSLLAPLWGTALANYVVPTKLASAAGLAVILQRRGVGLHTAAHAIFVSSILTLVIALAIGAPAAFGAAFLRDSPWLPVTHALAGIAMLFALACLHPRVFSALLNPILVRLRQPKLAATLLWLPFGRAVGWTLAHLAARALALAFAAQALAPLPWSEFGTVLTTTGLAVGAGSLAFFAPAGLGVHEAIYLVGLTPLLGSSVALLIVVFRVLVSVVDVVCGGAALAFFRSQSDGRGERGAVGVSVGGEGATDSPAVIAVANVAGIGNALLAQPLVAALCQHFPESRIIVLSRTAPMAEVFQRMPDLEQDDVWVCRGGLPALVRMHWRLRRLRPDIYIAPWPSNRWEYVALALASGARTRIMHRYSVGRVERVERVGRWSALRFLPGDYVPAQRGLHDVEQNLNLLRPLGLDPSAPTPPVFALRAADRELATERLRRAGIDPDAGFVAIHPGSAAHGIAKRWPASRYRALLEGLRADPGLAVVLLEGPDERGVADEILAGRPPSGVAVFQLTGPLAEAAALLERAALYVGQDSGLAHLAAAVGRPAVALFGPGDPDRACPFANREWAQQPATAGAQPGQLYPYEATRPRLRKRGAMQVQDIPTEQMLAAARQALARQT